MNQILSTIALAVGCFFLGAGYVMRAVEMVERHATRQSLVVLLCGLGLLAIWMVIVLGVGE